MSHIVKSNVTSKVVRITQYPKTANSKVNTSGMNTTSFKPHQTPTPATDGAQKVFTLPDSEQYASGLLEVFLDGIRQTKDTDYTETTSTTFTMTTAPAADEVLRIKYIKQ